MVCGDDDQVGACSTVLWPVLFSGDLFRIIKLDQACLDLWIQEVNKGAIGYKN
jgi:hypothetical protein